MLEIRLVLTAVTAGAVRHCRQEQEQGGDADLLSHFPQEKSMPIPGSSESKRTIQSRKEIPSERNDFLQPERSWIELDMTSFAVIRGCRVPTADAYPGLRVAPSMRTGSTDEYVAFAGARGCRYVRSILFVSMADG
ncbi:hypothetical protein B0H16DRAFT_1464172 [Mycena metata]|uniref:Uncharacterized protein n=1 Tax=Mycena metata TaxID=1033252 RepID=A0AAD7IHG0_9AGAR|nr:hypothetical protein B0H16DRAFT_1464172 [Mycena metata]